MYMNDFKFSLSKYFKKSNNISFNKYFEKINKPFAVPRLHFELPYEVQALYFALPLEDS